MNDDPISLVIRAYLDRAWQIPSGPLLRAMRDNDRDTFYKLVETSQPEWYLPEPDYPVEMYKFLLESQAWLAPSPTRR